MKPTTKPDGTAGRMTAHGYLAKGKHMDLTELIQAFCDSDTAQRYNLDLPWNIGRQVMATDGYALVACQSALFHGPLADESAKVPNNVASLLVDHNDATGWAAIPELPPCGQCGSTGLVLTECDDCGHESVRPCLDSGCHIQAFGRHFGRAYINRFREFPNCRWAVAPNGLHADYVFFEFTGGIGMLNRLSSEYEVDE